MKLRSVPTILLAAALATGCAARPSPSPPPAPAAINPDFPVKPAPDAVRRVTYNSAKEIPGPGLFIIDLTTGKVESWQRAGAPEAQWQFRLSDDRRWAVSEGQEQVCWADRQSGKAFTWNVRDVQLLATGADQFLMAASGKFYVTDSEFQPRYTFTLDLPQANAIQAQFAPDGKRVALNVNTHIYLVDVATGKSTDLGPAPVPANGQVMDAELLGPAGNELVISYAVQQVEPTGLSREQSIIRRFSWDGKKLGEFPLIGRAGRISPDGRLLVSAEMLDHLTDVAAVTDLTTGQPRFRVLGAYGSQWTADGSRLVLEGRDGREYLVSATGELKPAPAVPAGGQRVFAPQLMAAPDDPHRFIYGLTVLDDTGKIIHAVELPNRSDWLVHSGVWGTSAKELVFSITPPMGKGNIGFDFPLAPQVQKPPFASPYLLTVQDPKGECVNLRESYSRSSRVIRCLPAGTKLAVADLAKAPEKLNVPWNYSDGQIWLWARTEQGETGWVSLSSGSVIWSR